MLRAHQALQASQLLLAALPHRPKESLPHSAQHTSGFCFPLNFWAGQFSFTLFSFTFFSYIFYLILTSSMHLKGCLLYLIG